jgi:hypothetical protein
MPIKAMQNSAQRGPYDELYTPYEALAHLLPYLPEGIIWESAPGTGKLVAMLQDNGHSVVWEDRDYFAWQPEHWDIQVTNPPFSKKADWLRRANDLGKPYAILLPVTSLGSRACQLQLLDASILLLPRRIDFTGKKAPWFATAWYCRHLPLPSRLTFIY